MPEPTLILATPSSASFATGGAPGPAITLSGTGIRATSSATISASVTPGTNTPPAPAST